MSWFTVSLTVRRSRHLPDDRFASTYELHVQVEAVTRELAIAMAAGHSAVGTLNEVVGARVLGSQEAVVAEPEGGGT